MGGDGISPLILEHSATALVDSIHSLCMFVPAIPFSSFEWRCHHIKCIPKLGESSLLCFISKVLEKICFRQDIPDFLTSIFIFNQQFGFVRTRSTLKQLLFYILYYC